MATVDKLSELTISFVKRNARAKGPTSSEAWNDQGDELSRDLTAIYSAWNNSLIPLLSLLPNSEDGYNVDAYTDGLDGRTLFVNTDASATDAVRYYNTGLVRPNTVYEQIQDIYSHIETRVNTVEDQLANVSLAAGDIAILDSGAVFSSSTVEGALQEVMNLVTTTGSDHGALDGLSDDDHTQYLNRSGVRAMTGTLQLGGNDITNVSSISTTYIISSTGCSFGGTAAIGTATITTETVTTSIIGTLTAGTFVASSGQLETIANLTSTSGTITLDTTVTGGKVYTNTGATGLVTYNLPVVSAVGNKGLWYTFYVNNANGIKIKAQFGDTIRLNTSVSAGAGFVQATALGCAITLMFMSNGVWATLSHEGSWTVT